MSDPDELQLHEDEGRPVTKKRRRNVETATKVEAIEWARRYSNHSAASKFNVTRSRIKDWKKKEDELRCQVNNTARGSKRKRLDGGGRHVSYPELDVELAEWVRIKRENKQPVSRQIISNKAKELFRGTDLKNHFRYRLVGSALSLHRHRFVYRRVTTTAQKPPENYAEAVAKFIVHLEQRRKAVKFAEVFAMDETAVWFDCPSSQCIDSIGAKDVTIVTTGHEKMRITVCLTARSDGKKLIPYVLVDRKRPIPKIEKQFEGKLVIKWNGSVWMNDATTSDFLMTIIGGAGPFAKKRLLVWDAFAAHKSESTLAVLKQLGVEAAFIPGGCTKFIQTPDVSWNKPLKERIRKSYTIWMANDAQKEFTKGGNPKAPALDLVLEWVHQAWQELSKDMIAKSFEVCALTTPTDGSGDDKITCFKPEGSIGGKGLTILNDIRAQQKAADGSNDFEEDGLEEGELADAEESNLTTLEDFNDEEYFMFVEQFI